jgi:hypothetical protein
MDYRPFLPFKKLPGLKVIAAAVLAAAPTHMIGQLIAGLGINVPHKSFIAMPAARAMVPR